MSVFAQSPLAEVCTIVGGGTPRRSNATYFGGPIPWATPTDVTSLDSLFIERTKEAITEVALKKSSARMIPAGTVLMTSRATIGYTAISTRPMATNQGFANLICGDLVLPEYLAYWLRDQRERLIELAGGTTFREITKSTLKKVCIPLPSLDEQRRIVAILNRAAKIKQLRAQSRKLMREFAPALFAKMFGDAVENPMAWEMKALGDFCDMDRRTIKPDDPGAPQLRFVGVENIVPDIGSLNFSAGSRVGHQKSSAFLFDERHILYGKLRPYLNKVATPDFRGRCSTELVPLLPRSRANRDFVAELLRRQETVEYVMASVTGSRMPRTNMESLLSMMVPVPPLHAQSRFAEFVESVRVASTLGTSGLCVAEQLNAALLTSHLGSSA